MPKGGLGVSRGFCGLHWMKSEPNSNATVTQALSGAEQRASVLFRMAALP